jgi:hypothetical protein
MLFLHLIHVPLFLSLQPERLPASLTDRESKSLIMRVEEHWSSFTKRSLATGLSKEYSSQLGFEVGNQSTKVLQIGFLMSHCPFSLIIAVTGVLAIDRGKGCHWVLWQPE